MSGLVKPVSILDHGDGQGADSPTLLVAPRSGITASNA